jgi:hypothetical protein
VTGRRASPPDGATGATGGGGVATDCADPGLVVADLGVVPTIRRARWSVMDERTRAAVCALRGQEADDLDRGTRVEHLWVPDVEGPVCYVRLVRRPGAGAVVDLLATEPDVASLGVLSVLLLDVVARHGAGPVVVTGQELPAELLRRFAFAPEGPGLWRRAPEAPWR